MKIEINNNAFWVLFWLIVGGCTATTNYADYQYRIAKLECATDEDKPTP